MFNADLLIENQGCGQAPFGNGRPSLAPHLTRIRATSCNTVVLKFSQGKGGDLVVGGNSLQHALVPKEAMYAQEGKQCAQDAG